MMASGIPASAKWLLPLVKPLELLQTWTWKHTVNINPESTEMLRLWYSLKTEYYGVIGGCCCGISWLHFWGILLNVILYFCSISNFLNFIWQTVTTSLHRFKFDMKKTTHGELIKCCAWLLNTEAGFFPNGFGFLQKRGVCSSSTKLGLWFHFNRPNCLRPNEVKSTNV